MTKRDLKSLVIPLFTIVLSKKTFSMTKKSAFIAVLIAPLKRVRRMVISVGFAKTGKRYFIGRRRLTKEDVNSTYP